MHTPRHTPCAKDGCDRVNCDDNAYCSKHQLCAFIDATVAAGKKVCKNHIRGCRAQLDLNETVRCEGCLEKEREIDRARRAASAAAAAIADATEKSCGKCCRVFPMEMFRGDKGVTTKTCRSCRDVNRRQDALRDREHRNALARVAEAQPERKDRKREARKRKATTNVENDDDDGDI